MAHICDSNVEYVEADVFAYLRKCRDEGKKFDLIVLDPPKFAETKTQLMKAYRGYKDINLLAMKLLKPNGTLATFSCSGAMTVEMFDKAYKEAARYGAAREVASSKDKTFSYIPKTTAADFDKDADYVHICMNNIHN